MTGRELRRAIESEAVPTPAMQAWRIALILLGVVLLLIGLVTLLNDVPPTRYAGLGVWLVAALVIHDGIGAMIVFGVAVLLRRTRLPFAIVAIVQAALVIAVVMAVIVVPEIVKKAVGTANPSVLPLDYLVHLAVFQSLLLLATALVIGAVMMTRSRVVGGDGQKEARQDGLGA